MTEQELRALVRDAVARHLGRPATAPGSSATPAPRAVLHAAHHAASHHTASRPADSPQPHVSHGLYVQLVNVAETCVIEPAVGCDHCGYCRSHGH